LQLEAALDGNAAHPASMHRHRPKGSVTVLPRLDTKRLNGL